VQFNDGLNVCYFTQDYPLINFKRIANQNQLNYTKSAYSYLVRTEKASPVVNGLIARARHLTILWALRYVDPRVVVAEEALLELVQSGDHGSRDGWVLARDVGVLRRVCHHVE
jgi:hypothetical protein